MSSSRAGASTGSTDQEIVNTKWGVVYMLKSDNYAIWRDSCKAAIMSAGAWTLVTGEVVRPAVTIAEDGTITNQRVLTAWDKAWEDKLTNAIRIITSTVHHTHRRNVLRFGEKRDVKGAWQELAKLNRANDPIWVNSTIQQFNQERFDPTTQTV
jgi:hypothetical protein